MAPAQPVQWIQCDPRKGQVQINKTNQPKRGSITFTKAIDVSNWILVNVEVEWKNEEEESEEELIKKWTIFPSFVRGSEANLSFHIDNNKRMHPKKLYFPSNNSCFCAPSFFSIPFWIIKMMFTWMQAREILEFQVHVLFGSVFVDYK